MIPSQKKKNRIEAFVYRYTITGTAFGSIDITFRADDWEQADEHADGEASISGKKAAATFKKAI